MGHLHNGGYYGPDIIVRYQLCMVPLVTQNGLEWKRYLAIDPDHVEEVVDVTWLIYETLTDHLKEHLMPEDRTFFPYWHETLQAMAFPAMDMEGIEALEQLLSFILAGPVGPILLPRNGTADWDDRSWHRTQSYLDQPAHDFEVQQKRLPEPPKTAWLRVPVDREETRALDAPWEHSTQTDFLNNEDNHRVMDLMAPDRDDTVTDI